MRKRMEDRHGRINFIPGLVIACFFFACAGAPTPIKYYKPKLVSWEGTLLGPTPADDLPGSVCAPDGQTDGKCVIIKADEFFSKKLECESSKDK